MKIKTDKMIDQVCSVCGKRFQSVEEFDYCSGQCFLKQRRLEKRELIKKAIKKEE